MYYSRISEVKRDQFENRKECNFLNSQRVKRSLVDIALQVDTIRTADLEEAHGEVVRLKTRLEAHILLDTRFKGIPGNYSRDRSEECAELLR